MWHLLFSDEQYRDELIRWENRLVKQCKICLGEGSIPTKDGTNRATMCSCFKEAHLNAKLVSCGVPRKYVTNKWTWEGCVQEQFVKQCKDYSDSFEENYFDGKGLYLFGALGRGKSTMESLIARDIAEKINPDTGSQFTVAFRIYEDIVQLKRQTHNDKSALYRFNKLVNRPDLLIIDNIGSEVGFGSDTGYTTKLLEYILRMRDNLCLPTIISSNLTPEELYDVYSDTIGDFIVENYKLISVTGDNHRKKISATDMVNDFLDGGEDW